MCHTCFCLARPCIGDGRACLCFVATWRATLGVTAATSVATAMLAAAAAMAAVPLLWLLLLLLLRLLLLLLLLLPWVAILLKAPVMLGGGDGCGGAGMLLGSITGWGSWLACKKESTNNFLPATLRRLRGTYFSPCSASHLMGMNDAPAFSAASFNAWTYFSTES